MDPREHLLRRADVDPSTIDEILLIAMETRADLPAGTLDPEDAGMMPALPGRILDDAVLEFERRRQSGQIAHIRATRAAARRRQVRMRQALIGGGLGVLALLTVALGAAVLASTGAQQLSRTEVHLERQREAVDRALDRQAHQAESLASLLPGQEARLTRLAARLRSEVPVEARVQAAEAVLAVTRATERPDDPTLTDRYSLVRQDTLSLATALDRENERLAEAAAQHEAARNTWSGRLATLFGFAP